MFHTLLWTAKHICSSNELYESEKAHLLQVFQELGYPKERLMHKVRQIEMPFFGPKLRRSTTKTCLSLPYVPGLTEDITRIIKKTTETHGLNDLDFSVTYRPISKLRSLLVSPYPRDPPGQCVYEATCSTCGKRYIGETGKLLESRIKSHSTAKNSSIREHEHCNFTWEMIARFHDINKRKIAEAFEISNKNPELNENIGVFRYCFKD